jgi:glycosyltransferase involved in cell wall biosynthesis
MPPASDDGPPAASAPNFAPDARKDLLMAPPKLSVLIPTYNQARFLPEAIESVLTQDFTDFELLIAVDCSTDNSAEIVTHYAATDPRIRPHFHDRRLGMIPNWNWCLANSRGEYLKFLFGDDRLTFPHALTSFVAMLDANPTATLAASARHLINEHSQILQVANDVGGPGLYSGTKLITRCLAQNTNLIGEPTVTLFRRRDAQCGFNAQFHHLADEEMWLHLLERGNLVFTPQPLCGFRRHENQASAANRTQAIEILESLQLLQDFRTKPYLGKRTVRQALGTQLYNLRKRLKRNPEDQPAPLKNTERQLANLLGESAFKRYRLCRTFTNPFKKMTRWFRKINNRKYLPPGNVIPASPPL